MNLIPEFIREFINIFKEKGVFIFGLPGSGKSTLFASVIHYIDNSNSYILRRDSLGNPDGARVIKQWIKSCHTHAFPLETGPNQWTKVRINYTEVGNGNLNSIGVYEVSGEIVATKLDPTNDNYKEHKKQYSSLLAFLEFSQGIIITAPSTQSADPMQHEAIREFLELISSIDYKKPICFVLTKYDLISHLYKNHYQAAQNLYPGVIKFLKDYDKSEVLSLSASNDHGKTFILKTDNHPAEPIFNWIKDL